MSRLGTLVLLAVTPAALGAQTSHTLNRPDARITEPFSVIRSVRELSDGRLVVADWLEQRVALADFGRDAVSDVGRRGSGPREFLMPSSLIPYRADSTLLVDAGNARIGVLDEQGVIRRFLQPPHAAARSPFGADARGRVYFAISPWQAQRPLTGDSLEIAMWDPANDEVRTVARAHGWTPSRQKPGEGPRIPYVVFAPQDAWTVTRDGNVAVVRDDGYYVDWVGGRRGPKQAVQPVRVTPTDQRDAAVAFQASSAVGGRGGQNSSPSGLSLPSAEERSDEETAKLIRASTFAETMAPFRSALASAAGHVWVARWVRAGQPARYDVFDAAGALLATVQAPAGQRVVAVGRAHAYVIRTDADDLQYLERHPLPAPLRASR